MNEASYISNERHHARTRAHTHEHITLIKVVFLCVFSFQTSFALVFFRGIVLRLEVTPNKKNTTNQNKSAASSPSTEATQSKKHT